MPRSSRWCFPWPCFFGALSSFRGQQKCFGLLPSFILRCFPSAINFFRKKLILRFDSRAGGRCNQVYLSIRVLSLELNSGGESEVERPFLVASLRRHRTISDLECHGPLATARHCLPLLELESKRCATLVFMVFRF